LVPDVQSATSLPKTYSNSEWVIRKIKPCHYT
jgi:hypothetical protein